jgi:uncharacterized protein YqgC (DUF456 family)
MLTVLGVIVAALFVAGLVGSVVPWMPGPLFILAGAVVWAVATDFQTLGWGRLAVLAALAVLSFLLDFLAAAIGARRYGASRWGVVGAILGAVVGLFLGPLGLIAGCVVGAVVGELARGADLAGGVRSGLGALVGFIAGLLADLVLAITMIALFLYWIWRA